jgi:hypothetical protein
MKRENYFWIGMIVLVLALVLVDYLLKLHIRDALIADPGMLKSPNERADQ